jgi:hypothetical protein
MRYPVLCLIFAAASLVSAQKLPPVDEAAADPSFLEFKNRLLAALQRKDVTTLVSVLDPEVRVGGSSPTGGSAEAGVEAFRRKWQLDKPAQSRIWDELGTALRLGVTRDEVEFIAPYVFTRFPHTLDAYTHAAVVSPNAELRKAPALAAPKLGLLQHDVVQTLGPPKNGWVEVRTEDRRSGWLQERDIRSPLDYRAFFERKQGRWKLTAFVNGGD